ncbi:MAG: YqjF family protein [Dehalococcoidia bacterium]
MKDKPAERPWPLPRAPWVIGQSWLDLLFAHWPCAVEQVRPWIPAALPLDTFEGQAWLSVVPFRMSQTRGRGMPSLPYLSSFHELNLRTYVTLGGKSGVFFFSLDAANPIAVQFGRRVYHLPYYRAQMAPTLTDDGVRYSSRRTDRAAPSAQFRAGYRPSGEVFQAVAGTLEHWLTARYCLYAVDRHERIYRTEIDHRPWSLQPAEAQIAVNSMSEPYGIPLRSSPLLQFSRRLDVHIWPPQRVT